VTVCNQRCFWACLLALIVCINLPIWTGVYNFLKVMRYDWDVLWHWKTSVWDVVLSVRVARECATDCISALQGNGIISSNFKRLVRGGVRGKFNRPRTAYSFHYPWFRYCTRDCFSFWKVSRAGAILLCDGSLSWLHWKVLMLDVKQSRSLLGKEGLWYSSLTAQPREKWNCGVWHACVSGQLENVGNKHFWHTMAPIHFLLCFFGV